MAANCVEHKSTMHFIGLLSDGNVHSNISHLKAMIAEAKKDGVSRVRVHILLDGRDVPATSALQYVDELEDFLTEQRDADFDCRIASGGGRMVITMDRYQANWNMVKEGWETHVHGVGRQFPTAKEAIETYRKEFEVMKTFLYNPSMTITKDALISSVWGMDSEATDNNVEVYISFLRKKLKYLKSRVSIRNLQKIGYRLEVAPC